MEGQYSFAAFANSNFSIQEYYLPWLTSSLPMMAIGYVIKKHETQIVILANKHRTILSIGTIILCLFPYIEHQLLCATHHYSGTFMISTFSAVVAMFIYCICDPTMGGQDAPYNHGRKVAFRQYLLLAIFPILSFYYQHDS